MAAQRKKSPPRKAQAPVYHGPRRFNPASRIARLERKVIVAERRAAALRRSGYLGMAQDEAARAKSLLADLRAAEASRAARWSGRRDRAAARIRQADNTIADFWTWVAATLLSLFNGNAGISEQAVAEPDETDEEHDERVAREINGTARRQIQDYLDRTMTPPLDWDDSSDRINLPPAVEPYQPPVRDQPPAEEAAMSSSLVRAHPHQPIDPENAHSGACTECGYGFAAPQHIAHFNDPSPAAEHGTPPSTTSPALPSAAPTSTGDAVSVSATAIDLWDRFFDRLFRGWAPGVPLWTPVENPVRGITAKTAKQIEANVDAKLAAKNAPRPTPEDDTRPQPEPQNLDDLNPAPPPSPAAQTGAPAIQTLQVGFDPNERWCICKGNAHDADCVARTSSPLELGAFASPPPMTATQ